MTNLDIFGMFDYVAGDNDTYEYTSDEFATFVDGLTDNGVSGKGNKFATTNTGLNLTVDTGICFINGRWGRNTASKTIAVDTDSQGYSRIDYLVIEYNKTNRLMGLAIVSGTHAVSNPVAPTLTQTDNLYQLPLYKITVVGGASPSLTLEDVRTILILPSQVLSAIESAVETAVGEAVAGISPSTIGAASLTNGKVTPTEASSAIITSTASRTFALTDNGKLILADSTSAIAFTIPPNVFPVGAEIEVCRWNTGAVSVAAGSGVAIGSLDSLLSISGRYGVGVLKQLATNVWLFAGALG